jgi:serine/threonine-protein kinase
LKLPPTPFSVEHFRRSREIVGETPDTVGLLGFACARAGDVTSARQALETLDRLAVRQHVPPIDRALVHMALGERDQAFHWIDQAVDAREVFAAYLGVDPLYDSLRDDARFTALLSRLNRPRVGG